MTRLFFFLSCFIPSLALFSYDFADAAKEILQEFETKNLKSTYGKELYENVKEISKDFTDNLSYIELERFVPKVHLEYMATHIVNTQPNTRIAILWPLLKGFDLELHNKFKKHFTILSYKRILLDERGAHNFLDQIPGLDADSNFDLLFKPPQHKETPVRVFLLQGSEDKIDQEVKDCASTIGSVIYFTQSHEETKELAKLVFNKNSLHCVKHRERKKGENFSKGRITPKENTIYEGDAVLYAYGIKDSYHQNYYSYEKPLDYISKHEKVYTMEKSPAVYTNIGFHKYGSKQRTLNTDDLLYNPNYHLYYNGLKYTAPDVAHFLHIVIPTSQSKEINQAIELIN